MGCRPNLLVREGLGDVPQQLQPIATLEREEPRTPLGLGELTLARPAVEEHAWKQKP